MGSIWKFIEGPGHYNQITKSEPKVPDFLSLVTGQHQPVNSNDFYHAGNLAYGGYELASAGIKAAWLYNNPPFGTSHELAGLRAAGSGFSGLNRIYKSGEYFRNRAGSSLLQWKRYLYQKYRNYKPKKFPVADQPQPKRLESSSVQAAQPEYYYYRRRYYYYRDRYPRFRKRYSRRRKFYRKKNLRRPYSKRRYW